MACFACGRQPQGAYPGIKYGKPLREIYEHNNMHPYVEGLFRHAITQKNKISLPATVTNRSLKKLRKNLKKSSDGLDYNKLKVSGHLALASIRDILNRLPAPLLVKNWQNATNWSKITKEIQYSTETLEDEDDDVSADQQVANINKIKQALQGMDQVDLLMFKYIVALIKVLASDEVSVRPQRLIPLCAYYAEVLVSNKNRKMELKNVMKSLEYMVSNADEIFDCYVEELLVPPKQDERGRKVSATAGTIDTMTWPPSSLTLQADENFSMPAMDNRRGSSELSTASMAQKARSTQSAEPRTKSSKTEYIDLAQQLAQISYSATQPKKPFSDIQQQVPAVVPEKSETSRSSGRSSIHSKVMFESTTHFSDDVASTYTGLSIKGLDISDKKLKNGDLWNYLVDNMEQQISEARASLVYFPNLI